MLFPNHPAHLANFIKIMVQTTRSRTSFVNFFVIITITMTRKIVFGTLNVLFWIILIGGVEMLLLQDIPLLCFAVIFAVSFLLPEWLYPIDPSLKPIKRNFWGVPIFPFHGF
jgi:hypothetical protein